MRLFIAVDLDDPARSLAATATKELARRIERLGQRPRIAWVDPENMHLTMRFLGEVPETDVPGLLEVFRVPLAVPPFEAKLSGLGAFPESGTPRVIWMGINDGGTGLRAVYAEMERRLRAVGIAAEDRPYAPHLTLGRVKDVHHGAGRALRDAIAAGMPGAAQWQVNHVTLYESRLSPHGPRYAVQMQARLGISS